MSGRPARRAARRSDGDPDLPDVLAAQGDRAAFGTLYRRYLDRVYGYAFYLLGDHHDAEDVTERTFLGALAAIASFRDEGASFRSWLFRIAHNQVANALRSRARRATATLEAEQHASEATDPAAAVGAADEARELRRALEGLSVDRRQVIVLRFVDGLSAREIGVVLGRSEGAVRVLQHRALRELAAALGDGGFRPAV